MVRTAGFQSVNGSSILPGAANTNLTMTYALAWRTEAAVFLAADSALTTFGSSGAPDRPRSSFGESHYQDSSRKVEERMPKLLLRKDIGATFAGNVQLAVQIIQTFHAEIDKGSLPKNALEWAIGMHHPRPTDRTVTIIIGYYSNHRPRLLTFNSKGDHTIREDEILVQAGSLPQEYKDFTEFSLAHILPGTVFEPERHLASMLGIFQTYSVFDELMDYGVGGAFSGLFIGESGGKWQPDILFILPKKLISTCYREECLLVGSPTIGESRCLLAYLPPKAMAEIQQQTSKAVELGKKVQSEACFDFVVLPNQESKTLTLIEMQKNPKHAYLWLQPFAKNGRTGTTLAIFPELEAIQKEKVFFKNIPYMPPTMDSIPEDKIIRRHIRRDSE